MASAVGYRIWEIRAYLGLGLPALGDVAADRLNLDQLPSLVEDPGIGPLLVAHATGVRRLELVGDGRPSGGQAGPGSADPLLGGRRIMAKADIIDPGEQDLAR